MAFVGEAAEEVQERMVELHPDWARMLCEPFLPVRRRVVCWVVTLFDVTLPPVFVKKIYSNTTADVLRLSSSSTPSPINYCGFDLCWPLG